MAKPINPNEEEMFKLYFTYDGNIHAMLEDEKCPFNAYSNLYDFCQRNKFKERLEDIQARAREMTNENFAGALAIKRTELIAIVRAVFVKYAKKLEAMTDVKDIDITASDVERMYKIFKTEIGEASEISRREFSSTLKDSTLKEWMISEGKRLEKEDPSLWKE